jgi:hypothetical protein
VREAYLTVRERGMREPKPVDTNRLQCVECGRVSQEDERGWRAHLTTDEDEPAERSSTARNATNASLANSGRANGWSAAQERWRR